MLKAMVSQVWLNYVTYAVISNGKILSVVKLTAYNSFMDVNYQAANNA